MQWPVGEISLGNSPLFARGRGLVHLIQGLAEGNPVSWAIAAGLIVIIGGMAIYKHYYD